MVKEIAFPLNKNIIDFCQLVRIVATHIRDTS